MSGVTGSQLPLHVVYAHNYLCMIYSFLVAFNSIFSVDGDILERGVHCTLNVRSREKQLVLFL